MSFSSSSSTLAVVDAFLSLARATTSAASALFQGPGSRPCFSRKACSAWNPRWNCAGRSILPKSDMTNSGASRDTFRGLNLMSLGILTCVATPPLT
uniref:Putative secreted protein n=1 Tax=Ixodes ricinus TaxID=34613 RepID=A0A6B0U9T0_IXORI